MCVRLKKLVNKILFFPHHQAQDPTAFGEEFARNARIVLRTRYKLLPFLYTLFYEAHMDGSTVVRPVMHEYVLTAASACSDSNPNNSNVEIYHRRNKEFKRIIPPFEPEALLGHPSLTSPPTPYPTPFAAPLYKLYMRFYLIGSQGTKKLGELTGNFCGDHRYLYHLF